MKKRLSLITLLLCLALQVSAQTDARIRQQINEAAARLNTLQCDFIQTKHLKLLNDKLVSKGKMYYQQANRLRWEYLSPYPYTFILNDSKVQIRNGKRNDVIDVRQNKVFREIARIMMNSVVGKSLNDEKDFTTRLSSTQTEYIATLTPQKKEIRQMFQSIILHFHRQNALVNRVELVERNGDKTVIELTNIQTDRTLDAKLFDMD